MIKSISAKKISDTRNEKTIQVSIKTSAGVFSASAPTGKSTGKFEAKTYKKSLDEDIKTLEKFGDYFIEESLDTFADLRRVEDIVDGHVGGNTIFALESAILKAIAKEKKKEIWEIVNAEIENGGDFKFPRLVGNCIGGGKHSEAIDGRKPDFQEFLLIPDSDSVKESFEINKKAKAKAKEILKREDKNFSGKMNDESAWMTSLNEKEVFDVLSNTEVPMGTDVASSGFYKRKNYHYKNPMLKRNSDEQLKYLENLIKNFGLFYVEDPFEEEDFESFAELLKKCPDSLIVGDDLTVTNYKRLEKAINMKSINALIVKPNQIGSLIEVSRVVEIAKKNGIKTIFSHRSGETDETILADLAFGFQADFIKCGITGKGREEKIKRLIEIEKKREK